MVGQSGRNCNNLSFLETLLTTILQTAVNIDQMKSFIAFAHHILSVKIFSYQLEQNMKSFIPIRILLISFIKRISLTPNCELLSISLISIIFCQ